MVPDPISAPPLDRLQQLDPTQRPPAPGIAYFPIGGRGGFATGFRGGRGVFIPNDDRGCGGRPGGFRGWVEDLLRLLCPYRSAFSTTAIRFA
ncbi:hypothetical protein K443DRAFT_679700 [Laccaria amethystina LaAM-08-1]|uniref:Uncharacterized protein n=1 Tax=Laccaria amethystina LaAM-08-1 TaxID=1095629 RepID=A0A0C9XDW8_9AGAR|nr:hypothetical protein K443DRAFT_679700 [Laccaria amethystina LaAM-08-1]